MKALDVILYLLSLNSAFGRHFFFTIYGSVNSKRAHPPPGHLSGICDLVGPGGGDLSENLCPGVGHAFVNSSRRG